MKTILALFSLALLAFQSGHLAAAPTLLGTPAQQYTTGNTLAFTVPAGTDRLLVVTAGDPGTPTNPSNVQFGTTPMSLGNSTSDDIYSCDSIWYLKLGSGPAESKTIQVFFGSSATHYIGAAAYSGVDQNNPVDANGPKISGQHNAIPTKSSSLDVTSQTDDLAFDLLDAYHDNVTPGTNPGGGQTVVNNVGGQGSVGYSRYTTSSKPGAASMVMSWTTTNNGASNSGIAILHLVMNINAGATSSAAPTVTSPTSGSITATTATLGGNVTADGGASITARGVVYSRTSLNNNPQLGGANVTNLPHGTNSTGIFTVNATGLLASTQYSYAAYATNSAGTTYTTPVSNFTTNAAPVAISFLVRGNFSPTNAGSITWNLQLGGQVTGLGIGNFSLSGPAAVGSNVASVITAPSGLQAVITVNTGSNDGELTLRLANDTGLSVPLSGTPFTGQSYTIDKTPPTVQSVTRLTPVAQATSNSSVTFRVTYSEEVTGVAAGRFAVVPVGSSNVVGSISSVTPVSPGIYDIGVNITSGSGEFRLRVVD